MFRGQAFDTFQLLIAAVVAIAILGVLLGILGSISPPGQSFDDTAKQLITKASQNPQATYPSAGDVQFKKGETYPGSIFTSSSGGYPIEYELGPVCGSETTAVCSVTTSTNALNISGNFRAALSVCCTDSTGHSCKIGIGKDVTC